ncbi:LOW QUALITY PROTEIN: uncharacterized protein LOC109834788 [Asparagus officinalis]|uniref:LOW QUALITY PROTEIN: uncharacterized protein LOC109834788 n=1 Tax=Asparagus officinalis TaxID=4686 RepID=UPI00098E317A|nr:LOW QUALITY PROTEIN: uncharacterized protein LOC109834788 [Asparagus officinalis]
MVGRSVDQGVVISWWREERGGWAVPERGYYFSTSGVQSPSPRPSPQSAAAHRRSRRPPRAAIEGNADIRRRQTQRHAAAAASLSRSLNFFFFFLLRAAKQQNPNHSDSFSEAELQAIGRSLRPGRPFIVREDDPNLKHPYDWYKYGQYGPYSWRGIVVGPPVRGRFSDDRVSLIGEVNDHEEWEEIEQFEMCQDFSPRLQALDEGIGFRYYWVFVRHPKWRVSELPWQQWTLVSEVAVEAGKDQRLDKWSLMGRFGNKTRAMITQCAAWQRPDIIYVKKPVYQCRFEPQDDFFKGLMPLVDPETEGEYVFELRREDGRVEMCSYFGGLCKMVKISPKSYVDDVVNAYEKMSDEGKSRCLEFLLTNHPMELLHPYTKEWKAKLEEMELGCDAPDESDNDGGGCENGMTDWIEEYDDDDNNDGSDDDEEEEEGSEDDTVIDVGEEGDSESDETETSPEESEEYWNEQWKKAVNSSDDMEKIVTKSIEVSDKYYKQQEIEEQQMKERMEEARRVSIDQDWEQGREDWESKGYKGPRRRAKKSKIPPELFLRAAVRPFTYRNLVKEIVLMRHAFLDGDIKRS